MGVLRRLARWSPRAKGLGRRLSVGLVFTAETVILEPGLGFAKRRIGARLGSSATAGEGTQILLCAYLAIAVFVGLAANTQFGGSMPQSP
jgi:hypothetical protein